MFLRRGFGFLRLFGPPAWLRDVYLKRISMGSKPYLPYLATPVNQRYGTKKPPSLAGLPYLPYLPYLF